MVCSDEEYLPPAGAHSVLCTNRMMHHCNGGIFALGAMYAYKEESLYGRAGSSGVTIRSFRPLYYSSSQSMDGGDNLAQGQIHQGSHGWAIGHQPISHSCMRTDFQNEKRPLFSDWRWRFLWFMLVFFCWFFLFLSLSFFFFLSFFFWRLFHNREQDS